MMKKWKRVNRMIALSLALSFMVGMFPLITAYAKTTTNDWSYNAKIGEAKTVVYLFSYENAKIAKNKLTVKRGDGDIFKFQPKGDRWSANIFENRISKKKVSYKLAKNCKIVLGYFDEDGVTYHETTKTVKWYNKNNGKWYVEWYKQYKNYETAVCLNKNGKVTMIYLLNGNYAGVDLF